jgi:hypothetical protein
VITVWERMESRRIGGFDPKGLRRDFEIPTDLLARPVRAVGEGRKPKARVEFLGHTSATDAMAALDHEDVEPGPGQVPGADEAVVPGANYECIGCTCHNLSKKSICSPRFFVRRIPGVTGGTFDFRGKSILFSSPGGLLRLRQTAIRIGDTASLSLISILS